MARSAHQIRRIAYAKREHISTVDTQHAITREANSEVHALAVQSIPNCRNAGGRSGPWDGNRFGPFNVSRNRTSMQAHPRKLERKSWASLNAASSVTA